jgi:hypothetical protein
MNVVTLNAQLSTFNSQRPTCTNGARFSLLGAGVASSFTARRYKLAAGDRRCNPQLSTFNLGLFNKSLFLE